MKYNDNGTYEDIVIKAVAPGRNSYSTSQQEVYSCNYTNGAIADGVTEAKSYVDDLQTYSTTEETICGNYNGSTLYRKVINVGNLPNATYSDTATGLTNVTIINMYGRAVGGSMGNTLTMPYVGTGVEANISLSYYLPTNSIRIQTLSDRSGFTGYVTLEYTKNS